MTDLLVSKQLTLPDDAVTETFALLAKRGAGKSNAAVVMAEQMHDAGLPWVAIDPKGDWWGVRSSKDGTGPGLPVLVLGGQHGDVPLEPTAGGLVADLIATERLTAVVDVSLMSKADSRRFLADFAERLYKVNNEPLHVFAEEAHEYIPQRVTAGDARMVGAWEKLVKWGRTHGLGVTLITQRSASLNKDVLTQVETLIALRTTGPQDIAAVRSWVDEHETGKEVLAELRRLPSGDAYVLSPQWLELDEPLRITFHRRRTFDSGATPKAGQKRTAPRSLAEVDLAALKEAMAETIERAKADDPKALRARIRDLEQQLAAQPTPEPEIVEINVLDPAIAFSFSEEAAPLLNLLAEVNQRLRALSSQTSAPRRNDPAPTPARPAPRTAERTTPRTTPSTGQGTDTKLGGTEKRILSTLALHGGLTHDQLALLSGYSRKASTIGVALGKLRKASLVADGQPIQATDAGVDWLGDDIEQLPTGQDLVDYWRNRFGGTEKRVLDAFLQVHPNGSNMQEIADLTGYSPIASTIGVAAGKLRRVGVLDGWRISDDFARAAGL